MKAITLEDARNWVAKHELTNYCSQPSVKLLGINPTEARKTCTGYTEALVIKVRKRLDRSKEYSVKDILDIGVDLFLITEIYIEDGEQ